jgi:hypothetical protein
MQAWRGLKACNPRSGPWSSFAFYIAELPPRMLAL